MPIGCPAGAHGHASLQWAFSRFTCFPPNDFSGEFRTTFVRIMALSSLRKKSGVGWRRWERERCTSSRGVRGRTGTVRAARRVLERRDLLLVEGGANRDREVAQHAAATLVAGLISLAQRLGKCRHYVQRLLRLSLAHVLLQDNGELQPHRLTGNVYL